MASINKRYDVVAGRPYTTRDGEDKKQWINVGRAVEWDDGGISIELHAVPTGNWFDGKLSLFEQKPKDEAPRQRQERPQRQSAPVDSFEDETIPF
jgi:hypothetical protein